MLTLFHATRSRSTRIIWLLEELSAPYELRHVSIRHGDGRGGDPDPANPHPDKKVPALLDGAVLVTESSAVAQHLADRFPEAGLAPPLGHPDRGPYLSWLSWIETEFGPAAFGRMAAGDGGTPAWDAALRRVAGGLGAGPHLLGERFSAADVMLGGTLGWVRALLPQDPALEGYLARLSGRPALARAMARDAAPERAEG